jgi:hypothetical protein
MQKISHTESDIRSINYMHQISDPSTICIRYQTHQQYASDIRPINNMHQIKDPTFIRPINYMHQISDPSTICIRYQIRQLYASDVTHMNYMHQMQDPSTMYNRYRTPSDPPTTCIRCHTHQYMHQLLDPSTKCISHKTHYMHHHPLICTRHRTHPSAI